MMDAAIIVAGGQGKRMNSDIPKQFQELLGTPVLLHTLKAFHAFNPSMDAIIVLPSQHIPYWENLCSEHDIDTPHRIVEGGKERFHSVRNGLHALKKDGLVAIHDGVRPGVSQELLKRCADTAKKRGNAVPAILPHESLRWIDEDDANTPLDRSRVRMLQTPQCFPSRALREAYRTEFQSILTDDASVYENVGHSIHLCEGDLSNIKITTPQDLWLMERLLSKLG